MTMSSNVQSEDNVQSLNQRSLMYRLISHCNGNGKGTYVALKVKQT